MDSVTIRPIDDTGWVEVFAHSPAPFTARVFARLAEQDGRFVVTRIIIDGERIDSGTLRRIPTGRIESIVNNPKDSYRSLLRPASGGGPWATEFVQVDEQIDAFLETDVVRLPARPRENRESARPKLSRPDGTDPEGFSRRVAEAYMDATLTTHHPAPLLAEEAGVPVTTVHRWILEARRRGYLPPARKGKAG